MRAPGFEQPLKSPRRLTKRDSRDAESDAINFATLPEPIRIACEALAAHLTAGKPLAAFDVNESEQRVNRVRLFDQVLDQVPDDAAFHRLLAVWGELTDGDRTAMADQAEFLRSRKHVSGVL